jgi:hypothetical protein|tara:strand:+ start:925 stop:1356 length:432 start_codon:yes stop_codon:yes gene_type:complete
MENVNIDVTIEEIIQELDDKNLLYLSSSKIKELKNNILQKMYLTRNELLHYHKVLKDYRFVDELDEIQIGKYVRWFNLANQEKISLTNGGIIIDIKDGKEDILIVCKNNRNRIYTFRLNQCIVFQKLSTQEQILIKIIDYASK